MAKSFLFIITALTFLALSSSLNIECQYGIGRYPTLGSLYRCIVYNNFNTNSQEAALIESESGEHSDGKTNDDVNAIHISDKNVEFFPQGLEKIFKNLKHIDMSYNKLKELHQSDLKPFPQLAHLELNSNQISSLADGIFDYNPELEVVWFSANKIFHVSENVFNNLNKLSWIGFSRNRCIDMESRGDLDKVKKVIKELKSKCN